MTDLPVLCPVRLITGHPCPGCGMTRAILALAQGDIERSLEMHPLAIVMVAQAMMLTAGFGLLKTSRSGELRPRQPAIGLPPVRATLVATPTQLLTAALAANAAALVIVWLVRWRLGLLGPVMAG